MKKVLLVVMVMGLVLFTGCIGEQTLTCTKDISSSGITMIQTVNVKFVNNKVDCGKKYKFENTSKFAPTTH